MFGAFVYEHPIYTGIYVDIAFFSFSQSFRSVFPSLKQFFVIQNFYTHHIFLRSTGTHRTRSRSSMSILHGVCLTTDVSRTSNAPLMFRELNTILCRCLLNTLTCTHKQHCCNKNLHCSIGSKERSNKYFSNLMYLAPLNKYCSNLFRICNKKP